MNMSTPDQAFEDSFFETVSTESKGRARAASAEAAFDRSVQEDLLSFDSVKKAGMKVSRTASGYRVHLAKNVTAFDLQTLLAGDNKDIKLQFTEELINYEPEDGLVNKSKVPLWVIKPSANQVVQIQRAW